MKNHKTKKGYALAIVIVMAFILTLTVASTYTIIIRYMFFAKKDLGQFNQEHQYTTTTTIPTEEGT